jgi:hypothetical protein
MSPLSKRFSVSFGLCLAAATPTLTSAAFIELEAAGNGAAAIQAAVDQFRADLGNPNNGNAPGPLSSGRREINWDGGGGVTASTVSPTPFNGFQGTRGALFTTPGTGFIQATPSGLATQFGNATYSSRFSVFSLERLFTPIGSNITDVTFFIPGTGTPATVSGFGAVFSDVDIAGSSSLTFFDINNNVLFSDLSITPGAEPANLSFAGAFDPTAQIFRVRIVSGNTALGPNNTGSVDVVALDDFIFAEPRAIPEPASLALLLLGLVLIPLSISTRIPATHETHQVSQ